MDEREQILKEMGRLEARMQQCRDRAVNDPELVELIRIRCWLRTDPDRVVGDVSGRIDAPEGWPDGVEADAEVEEYIDRAFDETEQLRRKAAELGYRLEPEEQW